MQFENVFWDQNAIENAGVFPSIIAIGDSWFWYPFPGGSLLNQIGPLVGPKLHNIIALGNNGAEAFDYVDGVYSKDMKTALRLHGPALSAVFISGGGNDFAGYNDLRPLLNDDCSKAKSAKACFKTGDEGRTIDWLMKKTAESYRSLIGQIMATSNPLTKIVMHNYDYAFPSGKGIFGNKGSWLKPALEDAKVPLKFHHDCIKHLINRLTDELQELTKIDNTRIVFVDSTDTLVETDWANELHPKAAGFKKIATQKWRPVLEQIGLA